MRFYSYPYKEISINRAFLEIPAEYQRKLQMGKVKQMVAEFNGIIVNPIAASRYHAKRRATGSDMLCEIEAAADNLKQRWEQAFQYYPDLLIDRDNRTAVAMIAQSLTNYLNEVEERTL